MKAVRHKRIILASFILSFFLFLILSALYSPVKKTLAEISNDYVKASGTKLSLHGQEYQFTGVNAFNLGTYPGANAGCGGYVENLDAFFAQLRPNSIVRMWAFQGTITTNVTTKRLDWTGLDRVVNAAEKNGKKLILVLGDQSGHCDDGHFKDKAWYEGGYKQSYNDLGNGLTPLSYSEYVKQVVARYKNSPAIAMWEPINEPIASNCLSGKGYECFAQQACPDETAAARAMRLFFDDVGSTIKSIDPNHLVSSGMIGDGQCGTIYEDYKYVHESPGIDVGSYHDYQRDIQPLPGDQWNGLSKRIDQLKLIGKPLIVGEVGMLASTNGAGCHTHSARESHLKAKMDAQFAAGIAGIIPWAATNTSSSTCNYDIGKDDPIMTLLRNYPVSMSNQMPTATTAPFPSPTPTPVDRTAPSIPTELTTTSIGNSSVALKWNASTDNIRVERYDIFRNYSYVTSVTGTSYTNTGLFSNTKYMYYVKAKDSSGNYSPASSQLTVTTLSGGAIPTPIPDLTPPSIPTNLRALTISTNQIALSWNQSTDNVGVSRYEVYKDYQYVTAVTGLTYTVTNLSPGNAYKFYLKARDNAGNSSGTSAIITVTTALSGPTPTPTNIPTPTPTRAPDTSPPTAPTNLRVTNKTSNQVSISWDNATDNVGVDRYEVYRDYQYITAVWGNSYTNSGLTPGKAYTYYLKARDKAGNSSPMSQRITVTTNQ